MIGQFYTFPYHKKRSDIYKEINKNLLEGKTFVLATIVQTAGSSPRQTGAKMIVYPDRSIFGTIGGGNFEKLVMDDCVKLFTEKENSHLFDVKKLIQKGIILYYLVSIAFIALLIYILKHKQYSELAKSLITAGIAIDLILIILLILNFTSIFDIFHKIFFTGNYLFDNSTLMLQMWGGNFFLIGAILSAVLTQAGALFCYALALMLYRRSDREPRRHR